jgi:hypothetical protein
MAGRRSASDNSFRQIALYGTYPKGIGRIAFMSPSFVTAAFALLLVSQADAATLCVNPGGTGGCFASIQGALDVAASSDLIVVAPGTYTENVDLPALRNVTIEGAGVGSTVLQTSGNVGVGITAQAPQTRITLRGVTIRGSIADDSRGVLALERTKVRLVECEITEHGVGIGVDRARIELESSWVHGNEYGIQYYSRFFEILRSTVSDNLFVGVLSVWGFTSDTARAPRIRVADSTISGNGNAGISELVGLGGFPGPAAGSRISRSTIVGNGVGIDVSSSVPTTSHRFRLDATVLSANTTDCNEIVRSDGYNFLGTACASTFVVGSGATSDVIGDDPMLGPLQDNGGPTLTHEPLEGSPVLEVVGRRSSCRNADQRLGARLPEPCDIGAAEAP